MMNSINKFLRKRYLHEHERGWENICLRVSASIAKREYETREFFEMMINRKGIPSSPILMNAGTDGYLSACSFVPMEDSIDSILGALNAMTKMQRDGGGTGFNFSKLRAEGVSISSGGTSSGPLSFLEGINAWSVAVKQGGKRRGANMAVMDMKHPDIKKFVNIKSDLTKLKSFNLSVKTNVSLFRLKTEIATLFDDIAFNIWDHGEPGILFWDNINCNT